MSGKKKVHDVSYEHSTRYLWATSSHRTVNLVSTLTCGFWRTRANSNLTRSHTEKNKSLHFALKKKKKKTYIQIRLEFKKKAFRVFSPSDIRLCFKNSFCQVIGVDPMTERFLQSLCSLYLSRWISACVSPRLSSWRVDSWAKWGEDFNSFSQVSSNRLGTTSHTLYKEPVLRFPDMLTTPPWTYMQPAWRRGAVQEMRRWHF